MISPQTMPGQAPFPFIAIFQNGPRRQGFASPRKTGAPLTAPGRSEKLPQTRERGQTQSPDHSRSAAMRASRHSPTAITPSCRLAPNPKIPAPTLDDVNKLRS